MKNHTQAMKRCARITALLVIASFLSLFCIAGLAWSFTDHGTHLNEKVVSGKAKLSAGKFKPAPAVRKKSGSDYAPACVGPGPRYSRASVIIHFSIFSANEVRGQCKHAVWSKSTFS